MIQKLGYNVIVQTYTQQQEIEVTARCNGWSARNIGTDTAKVNGITLTTGQSVTIGGNLGEIYEGRIQVSFLTALNPLLEIVQKYYLNEPR